MEKAVACLAMLIAACAPDPAKNPQPLELESFPREFVSAGAEYRSAWQLSSANYSRPIHITNPGATLRVGVRPSSADSPVTLTIHRNGESVAIERADDVDSWFDFRIPLEFGDAEYDLTLACGEDFWLSHCEITESIAEKPNVLLFLVDTLRPDRMGCYGYDRNTTPNIDAFAAEGSRFTNVVAQSTWTRASVASILTSTYPGSHGAEDRPDVLRKDLPSIAATLRGNGYTTIGINSNTNLQTRWGFGHDFDRYMDLTALTELDYNDRDRLVIERARGVLDDVDGRPWLLYLHLMAPHGPYSPPPPFNEKFPAVIEGLNQYEGLAEIIRSRYDGEIAFVDSLFAQITHDLEERGALDNTIVVFVSDHGEQFHEHGYGGHGFTLFDEELLVPLIIKPARSNGMPRVVESIVELVDIAPTILDLIGNDPNPRFQGLSLKTVLDGVDVLPRLGFAQLRLGNVDMNAVRSVQYKYVYDATTRTESFYDLTAIPREGAPLSKPPPEAAVLIEYARRRATADENGFHLLITDIAKSNRPVTGSVTIRGMRDYIFRNAGGAIEVDRDGDTILFDGRMKAPSVHDNMLRVWMISTPMTNFIHLRIDAELGMEASITITRDDNPLDAVVRAGQEGVDIPLDGTPILMTDLIATPDRYSMPTLPVQFAVYAWYVPGVDTIQDQDLPPEVLESLDALGYVR